VLCRARASLAAANSASRSQWFKLVRLLSQFVDPPPPNRCAFARRCAAAAANTMGKGVASSSQSLSKWELPSVLPNPSLHPKCYSGLRPLPPSGELKR
jgi:hypothetical protein